MILLLLQLTPTPWSRVGHVKLLCWLNKSVPCMKNEGLLHHSQKFNTGSYLEPLKSSPHAVSFRIHFNVILSTLVSSKWVIPFMFSDWNCLCTSHLPHECCISVPAHPPQFHQYR